MMTLGELADLMPGATLTGEAGRPFRAISTDTRHLPEEAVFFALHGERFDAHDFADQAVASGALALVVERPLAFAVPQIVVPDTRLALGAAAAGWRARFDIPVIAVTGSNGKTTVTQMLAGILATAAGEDGRLSTRGNLNNDIGLPLTLFRLRPEHRYAVVELGMNHPGEIAYLAGIAQPTVALVNNAQREHQEFMGTVEATAHENGAAIAALPADGVAVFPADDDCAPVWRELAGARRILDFGFRQPAAVGARFAPIPGGLHLSLNMPEGPIECRLQLAGAHNAHNAAAAASAALAAGIAPAIIRRGLEAFTPVSGRGVIRRATAGATVIDDSYNANPDSVRAAIELLAGLTGTRVLVLGDMGEVGNQGPAFHAEIGGYARERGLETLLALGEQTRAAVAAFGGPAEHCAGIETLIEAARRLSGPGATLLVKGSRFMRMERVVEALCGDGAAAR
ncbi:UDP-N-acetylmuramoyl-tripeptide--D-alanyl-D-alanine ligase [Methyloparacoccus murrellii]